MSEAIITNSVARTIKVLPGKSAAIGSTVAIPAKSSADNLDYTFDFSPWFEATGDTISKYSVTVLGAPQGENDLAYFRDQKTDTSVSFFLGGGIPGFQRRINIGILTAQGRIFTQPAIISITLATAETAPSNGVVFPDDAKTNGGVLVSGDTSLPTGYSSNGLVVMATPETKGPVGTPSFESVAAQSYSGDGSGLNVTSGKTSQTLAEWIAALSSGATDGVGIKSIEASQDDVAAGQPSKVTLTATLTDGTNSTTTFELPAGANGSNATVTAASIERALGYVPAVPLLKPYVYTDNTPNRITVDMGGGLYGDLNNSSTSWNYWYMPATAPNGWNILVYTGPKDTSIKYADNSANIINGSDIAYNKIVKVINIGAEENPIWICG